MTREQWKERLPLIEAFVRGEEIQCNNAAGWGPITEDPEFTYPVGNYRIKPEPKLIPWTLETCRVGAVIRLKGGTKRNLCIGCDENHANFGREWLSYKELLSEYEVLINGNWEPCGLVVIETT